MLRVLPAGGGYARLPGMRIPATEEARQAVADATQLWRPGQPLQYAPRVAVGESYDLVLTPHAADMYFALKLRELLKRLEKNPPAHSSGVFVVPNVAGVEAGLRVRWGIESIEGAWGYLQSKVIGPVLGEFPHLVEVEELTESDCYFRLMQEIIPDTKPPHHEAWVPYTREKLTKYWKTGLHNDVIDEIRATQRREALATQKGDDAERGTWEEPRLVIQQAPGVIEGFGEIGVTYERLEVTATFEALGDYGEYLFEDATPESLGVSSSTFYDRRAKGRAVLDARFPGVAKLLPSRRRKFPPPPE